MKIVYSTKKVEKQCTDFKTACKLFGGNRELAISLLSRINKIETADAIKDIIMIPNYHFHNLEGKRRGTFAIDVKSRRDKWRLILQPLTDDEKPFDPCSINEIAAIVRVIEIREVSPHYE